MLKETAFSINKVFQNIITNYYSVRKINSHTPALKLIDYNLQEDTNELYFKVQVTGKNLFPELSAKEMLEDSLLFSFDKEDQKVIRTLIYHLHKDENTSFVLFP